MNVSSNTAIAKILSPRYAINFCRTCKHPMFYHRVRYIKEYDDWPEICIYHDCTWWKEVELTERDFPVQGYHNQEYNKSPDHIEIKRKIFAKCKCQEFRASPKTKYMDELCLRDE